MIIEITRTYTRNNRTFKQGQASCDNCHNLFAFDKRSDNVGEYIFCSLRCVNEAQRGGCLKTKKEQHFRRKYGVSNPFQAKECQEKSRQSCLTKFGVDHPQRSSGIREKTEATNIIRYGVASPLQLKDVHSQGIKVASSKSSREKAHRTCHRRGHYNRSKIEDRFFEYLTGRFGDVKRALVVNGWEIDFYILSIDTYVQFDGVYWHGLDRPIETICEFNSPRDMVIYGTFCRDREQDEWFVTNHLRLLRVTDLQFKQGDHVSFD